MTLEHLLSKTDKSTVKLVGGFSEQFIALNKHAEVPESLCEKILDAYERNKQGEPLAYIVGERAFYRDVFKVRKGVLIPQPDTETLVEEAVNYLKTISSQSICILDLCAGSGCIGISVAKEIAPFFEKVELYMSDISPVAFECFSENASLLIKQQNIEVHNCKGDLFEPLKDIKFDLILSNPPYIASNVIPSLSKEVQNEPLLALDGGNDGLSFYKRIVQKAPLFLKNKSVLMLEIGFDQAQSVMNLLACKSFCQIEVVKDLGNNDRVVKAFIK